MIVKNGEKSTEVKEMVERVNARQQQRREIKRENDMDKELEQMFEKRVRINVVVKQPQQKYTTTKNESKFRYITILLTIIFISCGVIAAINEYTGTSVVFNMLAAFTVLFSGMV